MKMQEMFDTVRDHLLAQGRPAMDADGGCVYRGPGELRCAIGALLTDEEYSSDMEGSGVADLHELGRIPERLRPEANLELMRDLQAVHDDYLPEEWPIRLCELAINRGLVP